MVKTLVATLAVSVLWINVCLAQHNTLTEQEKSEGWVLLFDGSTLNGWTAYAEDEPPRPWLPENVVDDTSREIPIDKCGYLVEQGEIHVTGKGGAYWIGTNQMYDDFELTLQVKLAPGANSGIFLRAPGPPAHPAIVGFEVQVIETFGKETNDMLTCGAIYDVLTPMRNMVSPPGQWNDVRIIVKGLQVQVIWNNFKVIDSDFGQLTEPMGKWDLPYSRMPLSGRIGLQNHGNEIWYRDIKLKSLSDKSASPEPSADGWITLFDGKSYRGWLNCDFTQPKNQIENGCINPHGAGTYMVMYEKPWSNFILSLDFKTTENCNSGIFVRANPLGWAASDPGYYGLEMQIDESAPDTGYGSTGALYQLIPLLKKTAKPVGQWNHVEITCDRDLLVIELNGQETVRTRLDDWTSPNKRLDGSSHKFTYALKDLQRSGFIGLQDHGADVWYKNIRLKPLP